MYHSAMEPRPVSCSSFAPLLRRMSYLILKRGFDLVFSLVLLVTCALLMAVIALVVWLDSPGKIIYTQIRLGAWPTWTNCRSCSTSLWAKWALLARAPNAPLFMTTLTAKSRTSAAVCRLCRAWLVTRRSMAAMIWTLQKSSNMIWSISITALYCLTFGAC